MTTATIDLPAKLVPVFSPNRGAARYRALYGGRGSGKSFSAALMAAVWGYAEPLRILCVREFQASIKQSMHAEIKAAIEAHPWLEAHYDVGVDYIRGSNGTEFIFRGLRRNEQSIKSLAKIDLTIVEEAEDIPEGSWLALEATVFRQPKSEIWALWNPKSEGSPVDRRFRVDNPPGLLIAEINWRDNPYFPEGLVALRDQQEKTLDKAVYDHVWEGAYLRALKGAYYADLLEVARKENRIGFYNKHAMNRVYAVWDIGSTSTAADATAIWMVQYVGEEIRWLNYYEAVGQPFEAHVNWLRENSYEGATCVLPHDGVKHDNVYSVTPEKFLREAGFATYVVPNQGKGAAVQRIYALRSMFPQCRFNEDTTVAGREALSWYHEKWDEKRNIGLGPDHDWASHCADAAGLVAVFAPTARGESASKSEPIRRNLRGLA
jgi:phage terminase large subunit